jgi:hypothetical protein
MKDQYGSVLREAMKKSMKEPFRSYTRVEHTEMLWQRRMDRTLKWGSIIVGSLFLIASCIIIGRFIYVWYR